MNSQNEDESSSLREQENSLKNSNEALESHLIADTAALLLDGDVGKEEHTDQENKGEGEQHTHELILDDTMDESADVRNAKVEEEQLTTESPQLDPIQNEDELLALTAALISGENEQEGRAKVVGSKGKVVQQDEKKKRPRAKSPVQRRAKKY